MSRVQTLASLAATSGGGEMTETITAQDFATNLADMIRAADLSGVEWAGPIENVDEWLAGNQQRTDEHGDSGLPGYCVQSSDGEIIVAFTGTGPHAAAYAELIAYMLNSADRIVAALRHTQEEVR